MKYWVYKESRILGPFDKEGVSGLPGLDSGTLVCEGDPAGGSWLPVGEIKDLTGLTSRSIGIDFDDMPTTVGLLDQLQIDASGYVGDDDFPGALSENLFQDAIHKKGFGDLLSGRDSSADAEASRAKEKVAELTIQLEKLYRHIAQLESAQTDLARRLADKNSELSRRPDGEVQAESAGPAKTFLSPAPPPLMGVPAPPPPAVPDLPPAPSDWSQSAGANGPLPAIFKDEPIPPTAPTPPITIMAAAPALPVIPSFALPEAAAPTPELTIQPKSLSFGKPKSFKIVPTVKSFKVLGAADIEPAAAAANPAVEFTMPVPEPTPAAAIPPPPVVLPPPEPTAPVTPIVPVNLAPAPVPAPLPTPAPEMPNPFASLAPPIPTPASPPPNTLSRSLPVSDISNAADSSTGDMAGSTDATMNFQPPETLARGRGVTAEAPVDGAAAARFAKPAPAPATGAPKSARNNKPFLIGGAVLVVLLVIVGMIFMRQPKDDLKQMANLDDGKAPIGLSADDSASAPPIVKPKVAESAPTPTAPTPGPSAEHQAAISTVKDFPLDGGRGTVGRWLQYSYTASPGAGSEEWNASTTGENNVLVEYRLVPGESGGKGALYLFEVDGNGLVMGKNLEARQMLAGGPPAEPAKTKKAKVPGKKTAKRRPVIEEPKEVPLLPLPDSGELRPPAEDDGSFGSDTIKSGI